jgi:hypothetical protein
MVLADQDGVFWATQEFQGSDSRLSVEGQPWESTTSRRLADVRDGSVRAPVGPLLSDAEWVYWVDAVQNRSGAYVIGTTIRRARKDGRDVQVLVTGLPGKVELLAADGERLILVKGGDKDVLLSLPKTGGTPSTLVGEIEGLTGLVVDESHLYWAERGPATSDGRGRDEWIAGRLARLPKGGGQTESLIQGLRNPGRLAHHGDQLYFTFEWRPLDGVIGRTSKQAGGLCIMPMPDDMQEIPRHLLADSTGVYWDGRWLSDLGGGSLWHTGTDGRIRRLAAARGTRTYGVLLLHLGPNQVVWLQSDDYGLLARVFRRSL